MTQKALKRVAIALLIIPLGILLLFTFGEVFSGDISGLQHLIQAIPLLLLAYLAYKKPLIAGIILLVISLALGILYSVIVSFTFQAILIVEAILFLPPFISGLLFILSSKRK